MKKPLAPELEPLIAEVIKHWMNEQPKETRWQKVLSLTATETQVLTDIMNEQPQKKESTVTINGLIEKLQAE